MIVVRGGGTGGACAGASAANLGTGTRAGTGVASPELAIV